VKVMIWLNAVRTSVTNISSVSFSKLMSESLSEANVCSAVSLESVSSSILAPDSSILSGGISRYSVNLLASIYLLDR